MNLWHHLRTSWKFQTQLQLATGFILVFIFTTIGFTLLVSSNLQNLLTMWGESQKINVYMSAEATPDDIKNVDAFLQKAEGIDKVQFISAQDSLKIFKDQLAVYAPDLTQDNEITKYVPSSFQFSIKSLAGAESETTIQNLSSQLRSLASVEEVSHGQEWYKNYSQFSRSLQAVIWFIACVVFLTSIFVMANMIKSSIYVRREEIEILELIGATRWKIRLPFLFESFFNTLIACALSLLVCYFIFDTIKDMLKSQLVFFQLSNHIRFLNFNEIGLVLFVAAFGSLFSAYLCVNKINTGWSAANRLRDL